MRSPLDKFHGALLRRPWWVLACCAAAVLLAVVLALGVEMRTSRSELAPPEDPDQARLDRLTAEFRGSQALIAAVEPSDGGPVDAAALRAFTDELAAAFEADPLTDDVFHKAPEDWLRTYGLYLAPAETLAPALDAIESRLSGDGRVPLGGIAELNDLLAAQMRRGLDEGSGNPADDGAAEGVERIADYLDWQAAFFDDPERTLAGLEGRSLFDLAADAGDGARRDGYLQTDDGRMLFLVVSPKTLDDRLPTLRGFVGRMRDIAAQVSERRQGFVVRFTGTPAMTVEEMDTVRRDSFVSAGVALVGVALLTLLVFRFKTHALLVLLALAAGLAWSMGAVRLELGYLNVITSSFISTLIGVGVAYGIHPVSEYELLGAHRSGDVRGAVREAFRRTAAAVATAAVTTSAAFFSILLMRFPGFAELGLVAGSGVLLCLAAALLMLPALVLVYGSARSRHARREDERERESALDKLWVRTLAHQTVRFPRSVLAACGALTLVAAFAANGIAFNINILDLLPRKAETLQTLRRMVEGSDLSPVFNMVVADDVEELRRLRQAASREPSIAEFQSVTQFLPDDPAEARRLVERVGGLVARVDPSHAALDRERLAGSLDELVDALDASAEAAFTAGESGLIDPLERALATAEELAGAVRGASPETVARWDAAEGRLWAWLGERVAEIRRMASAGPPQVESLPSEVLDRFVTRGGRFVAFLQPAQNVFEPRALETYVAASRRVSADAIGFPTMFWLTSNRITRGFYRAIAIGALLVFVILWIDFRRLRDAALAMVPLGMGVAWMLGGMRLFGFDFNFANLVAVPLIIGVGIDNGVHVIHRFRFEGERGMETVLRHTGRAILIASMTTMIGFGSLALASHRGMASLGWLLLMGVGACLVTSMVVLPNLLIVLGLGKR